MKRLLALAITLYSLPILADSYYMVGARDFKPNTVQRDYEVTAAEGLTPTDVDDGNQGIFSARLDLPLGASFRSIACQVYDSSGIEDINVRIRRFHRRSVASGSIDYTDIFTMTTVNTPGAQRIADSSPRTEADRIIKGFETVNGESHYYSYYVMAFTGGKRTGIRSCVITYL